MLIHFDPCWSILIDVDPFWGGVPCGAYNRTDSKLALILTVPKINGWVAILCWDKALKFDKLSQSLSLKQTTGSPWNWTKKCKMLNFYHLFKKSYHNFTWSWWKKGSSLQPSSYEFKRQLFEEGIVQGNLLFHYSHSRKYPVSALVVQRWKNRSRNFAEPYPG